MTFPLKTPAIESRLRTCYIPAMSSPVRRHYELYPYPDYPLLASVRRCDTHALNLEALWARFNGELPLPGARKILIAGCGSFSPYPYAVANPDAEITALDLSQKSLDRARLHCRLHGKFSVRFCCGDLLDENTCDSLFGMIDAFGVLHHLERPLAGLKALTARLCDNGIIRIMVYSRYARREEESIRRAMKLLGVHDTATVKDMIRRSRPGSRLRQYAETAFEARFDSGLADALLHPCVRTYRIDELMELVRRSGLTPLLFAHDNALEQVEDEVERIRAMEAERLSPGNFVLYLGRNVRGPCRGDADSLVKLNPCLAGCLGDFRLLPLRIASRLGHATPLLDRSNRAFLRRFSRPMQWNRLDEKTRTRVQEYVKHQFLLHYA